MKAITLWQPWASLIACGVKDVETRSWPPPESLIGQRIAIHAAKRKVSRIDTSPELARAMCEQIGLSCDHGDPWTVLNTLPRGAVLCTAVLSDAWMVNRHEESTGVLRAESHEILVDVVKVCGLDAWGDFTPGRWLWFLDDIKVLDEAVVATGRQQFWDWEEGVS